MTTKHPHAEWIKLFVDGVAIEYLAAGDWVAVRGLQEFEGQSAQFRRAPERKKYRVAKMKNGNYFHTKTVDSYGDAQRMFENRHFVEWLTDWVEYD
jgi:hypothetical protein